MAARGRRHRRIVYRPAQDQDGRTVVCLPQFVGRPQRDLHAARGAQRGDQPGRRQRHPDDDHRQIAAAKFRRPFSKKPIKNREAFTRFPDLSARSEKLFRSRIRRNHVDQIDFIVQCRVGGNHLTAALFAVSQFGRQPQFDFAAFAYQLHTFGPTRDYALQRNVGGILAVIGILQILSFAVGHLVEYAYGRSRIGFHALVTHFNDLVQQARSGLLHVASFFGFGDEFRAGDTVFTGFNHRVVFAHKVIGGLLAHHGSIALGNILHRFCDHRQIQVGVQHRIHVLDIAAHIQAHSIGQRIFGRFEAASAGRGAGAEEKGGYTA